jgi:tetratricopeptide (TPR) repeat protein
MGEFEQATSVYQESLALAREADDKLAVAQALLGLSDITRGLGAAAEMVVHCQEALALSREIGGDTEAEGYALHNLGVAAWLQNDLPRAETLLADSLALFRERAYPAAIAEVLTSVGRVERASGHPERARSAFVESLTLARPSGPFFVMPDNLEELAGLAAEGRQIELAARLLGATQGLRNGKRIRPTGIRQTRHERAVAEVRTQLGDADFEAAYLAGQELGCEDAIALALEACIATRQTP